MNMIPDCTLVTACFDLTKYNTHSRDFNDSLNKMSALLAVPCYLIIYTDNSLYEHIKNKRNEFNLENMTHYIVTDLEKLETFKFVQFVKKNREKYHPTKDERTCAESHLVCCSKFELVLNMIKLNPFNTSKFGWIDANVGENFSKICVNYKNNMLLNILNNCSENKFHIQILNVCNKDFIKEENLRDYYSTYRWIVCGCLFITGKELGLKILNDLNNIFIKHTMHGYGHGEEMFYLEILDKYYDDIERSYGDYKNILNNFIRPTDDYYYIYNFIIRNYLHFGYHREGYDCCKKIINQIENFTVDVSYDLYLDILFSYYLFTFYYKNKEEARKVVEHIKNIVSKHPLIKNEYNKKSELFESQFSYCN